jgi:hypothetical protein
MIKRYLLVFLFIGCILHLNAQDNSKDAAFPGGEEAWNTYLDTAFHREVMNKLMTKKDFERFGSTQRVVYYFSIMTDGSIGLINIEGAASQAVRNEIQRVLKTSPRWTPATLNGKASIFRKKQVSTFSFDLPAL